MIRDILDGKMGSHHRVVVIILIDIHDLQ